MNRIIFTTIFYVALLNCQAQQLSDKAEISLITIGATQKELYSAFGHSAIRVNDPVQGMDLFFNYGVFNFNQPNFYLNFARGLNYYQLAVNEFSLYRDYYVSENRSIHEQILNLTANQKQKVFDFLTWNARPENKVYLYDYFYDNCATRPRDVLIKSLGADVLFDETPEKKSITIRGLTDIYLKQQPWGDLGIDICLGLPMDKVAKRTEYMFLPDSLESGFAQGKIKSDSAWVPLVEQKILVFESTPVQNSFSFFHPWIVFGLISLGLILLSIYDWSRKKITVWVDKIFLSVTGLIGILLVVLWLFTSHKAAANNLNILWALPTNLIFVFLRKGRQQYFMIATIISIMLLISWFFLPQQLHVFLIPLVIAFATRYWVNYKLQSWNSKSISIK